MKMVFASCAGCSTPRTSCSARSRDSKAVSPRLLILLLLCPVLACRGRSAEQRAADSVVAAVNASIAAAESTLIPGHQIFDEVVVQEHPRLLTAPSLEYPSKLRQAGVEGRVLVQLVLDTTGRVEQTSVKILRTPNAGFDRPVRNYLLRARFTPARNHGEPVRVRLNLPIDFRIQP